jgi:hypothetical protein
MKVSRGLIAVAMLTLAVPVCAQSLGELAKKEQERRKASPPASKVYTNDDLKKIYVPQTTEAESKDTKAPKDAADTKDPKAADAKDAKPAEPAMDEAAWRARISAAREDVRKARCSATRSSRASTA